MSALRLLLPAAVVSALLGALASVLNHGVEAGLSRGLLEGVGRLYFGVLLLAPLAIYPFALWSGEPLRVRVVLSLLPGFLWWLSEIGVRLQWHSPAEALWLVCGPVNLAHLYVSLLAIGVAHLAMRLVGWARGGEPPDLRLRTLAGSAALIVVPVLVIGGSILPYLLGYQRVFQTGLPLPDALPGALPAEEVVRSGATPARLPNVVFILSDDHRFDFAGYEDHPFVETPSLDRLAAEGVRFDRAYVTTSLCSPSRASFLTGTYPHRHGVWNNFTPWSDANRTFLEYLKAVGYRTAFVGKWHMPGGLPELRGVDHFVTFTNVGGQGVYEWCPLVVNGREEPSRTRYIAEELTDRALEWLETQGDAPFALYLSHKSVHADFTPDEPERGRYAGRKPDFPRGVHPWTHATGAQYVHLSFQPLDDMVRAYGEAITSMDRQIGRVLDFLDARGLADNTLVVYTSDNGYQWGEHGLVDKRWPYEESIRIPFLVRFPPARHLAGARVDRILMNVDVAPTLLALAGIDPPGWMQGRSFLPLLGDPAAPWRNAALYSYSFEPPYPAPESRALLTERFKLIEYEGGVPELFDLESDPQEQVNRAEDPDLRALRADLEARLAALRVEIRR
jgi:N-acetylglucosamine-6-sulfatase